MQLTMEWQNFEKTTSTVPSSNVLLMVIGSGLGCAMWQFGWWGLRIEMPSDRAH
jgi:hypothetical protein